MGRRRPGYGGGDGPGSAGGGPVRVIFSVYATLIVVGLAYFIALGVANR
ncbi:MAG TPA: hypothetical protein VL422_17875 [Miltoncostaea sp.]|nr:hypothetical protein [Miltoncostaea sp.]